MSKVLVIVESPAKAKTISKFLGRKYVVRASMGHIRDLPRSQFGVNVEANFEPKYITIRGKGDIIKELRAEAKKASRVLLGPDPDREGEAIAWHLQHILNIEEESACRIEFNEITKAAVETAVKKPRIIDVDRVNAQQARRILDRLVGYNLSPLLWRKVKRGLSAGRVQSVAVRLISDREEEINAFVPEEYWTVEVLLAALNGELTARLQSRGGRKLEILDEASAKKTLAALRKAQYFVDSVKSRDKHRSPAPPFTTSTLQQEAYRKLGFTSRKTMRIAQQLYEGLDLGPEGTVGLVSYIRTDSTRISDTARSEAQSFITARFGREYVPAEARQYAAKGKVQNAHEAIRPTSVNRVPDSMKPFLTSDQHRLYQLVWERFLASQMSSAVLETTTVDIKAGEYGLRSTGSIIKFPGFMKMYIEGRDDETREEEGLLPRVSEGELLKPLKFNPKQHFTQPPPRYTEATLVKTLEELGIGRPSTYAPIIETILYRGYVERKEKQFRPTELGVLIVALLKDYFTDIIDVDFTATMEQKLDQIEEGELSWQGVVEKFYFPFNESLKVAEDKIGEVEIHDEVSDQICENCGRNMVIKHGPFGKFLACPGFPECRNTKPILEEIGINCPECTGKVVARRSKKGRKFFGCSDFPRCRFVSWYQPTDKRCPVCGSVLVEKPSRQKGTRIACSHKGCRYEEKQAGTAPARAKSTSARQSKPVPEN